MDDLIGGFSSKPAPASSRYDSFFDSFYDPPPAPKPAAASPDHPVFDKPVFDDDDGGGVTFDNIFAHSAAASAPSAPPEDPEEDYLESLGKKVGAGRNTASGLGAFDDHGDLIPGFGRSSQRSGDSSGDKHNLEGISSYEPKMGVQEDPFVVLESTSTSAFSSYGAFADPLESFGRSMSSRREKKDTTPSGGLFDDSNDFETFPKFVSLSSDGTNYQQKSAKTLDGGERAETRASAEPFEHILPEVHTEKSFDPYDSFGHNQFESSKAQSRNVMEDSPKGSNDDGTYDDVWLTVSDIPLVTHPTAAPPPLRPPPPLKARQTLLESNAVRRDMDDPQTGKMFNYSMDSDKKFRASQIDELEGFATLRPQNSNGFSDILSNEDKQKYSFTEFEQVSDEQLEDRNRQELHRSHFEKENEALHEQEQREKEDEERSKLEKELEMDREKEKAAKLAVEKAVREARERAAADARAQAEKQARLRAERALVQKVAAEARERAAAEARERAAKAAAESREKAAAEARERAAKAAAEARERAAKIAAAEARERAAAEARERAAAEARERAAAEARERAAAEARERAAAEARTKAERDAVQKASAEARRRAERAAVERAAAEARERAAAEAREKAAAAAAASAREKQQPHRVDDLDSLFGGSRATSTPKQRDPSKDTSDTQPQSRAGSAGVRRSSSAQAVAANNPFDDLSSIFGASSSSEVFQEIDGETEERRKARLERHQRTLERAAKALAEKNQRDMQMQQEQEERHRIGESLDYEIKRWAAGKEGNLRALLSTLQYILWPECGWRAVSLTDLITAAAVKKEYRKATLCIHPDKVQQKGASLQQKYIAEKVFDLLKEAWNKFNSEELF